MISDLLTRRGLVRALPWILWIGALAAAIPIWSRTAGLGIAPALVEVRRVNLGGPRALRVAEILVKPGDPVQVDQVVARLEASEVEAGLDVERAELRRLELEIGSRTVSLRDERTLTMNRLSAEAERAALDVSQLVAQAERDRSELAQLTEQVARERRLVEQKLARSDTLNALVLRQAALAREVQESAATIDQARRNAGATTQRLGAWRSGAIAAKSTTTPLESHLAPARAAVEAQRARVHQLELLRARLDLRAPFDGRVGEVLLRPGDFAAEGAPVVSLVDTRATSAVAYVDERWAWRVREGDRVRLAPADRSGAPLAGRVAALGAAIVELPVRFRPFPTEPAFGREVFVALDAPAPLPGQAFNATFERAESP